ncbi:TonB-dependent receptor [Mucilaginibacter sp. PAMB04168]|uniref:SusC/RagA family TonB-linked outer membrane protein n=1 Tax=Mucilaginibacter sp. PAMB04168 TaxID=3138567 RepID=UPI0031F6BA8E
MRKFTFQIKIGSIILACLLVWLTPLKLFAQEGSVSGKVTSKDDPDGIPGISVTVKGTTRGTLTDAQGKFRVNASNGTVLVFSGIGYSSLEISVTGPTLNVNLETSQRSLQDVVVVGYGTQKKGNVTGAIAKITDKQIDERPITRVEQALQGQLAGVQVRNVSGSPGSDITVNVRGAASISGSAAPLYVVDGVPLDNLSGINPADIASIDVLKDASSAAIYGSRGSNGVVLVTTKRGKTGKPALSVSAYTALASAERKVQVLNSDEWIEFNKKWLDRQWVLKTGQSAGVSQADRIAYASRTDGKTYTTRNDLLGIRATYGIYDPYWSNGALEKIDWQDEVLRTAPVHDLQISASGANDIVNYAISGGAYRQDGIVVGSSYSRYSFRSNVEAKLSDRVKVGLTLAPSIGTIKGPNVDGKDNAVARALSYPGWVLTGSGRMAGASPYKYYDGWGPGPNVVSPYVQAVYNDRVNSDVRLNSAFNTTVNIIKGLDINGLIGWNYRGNSQRTYSPTWIQPTWDSATPGQLSTSTKTTLNSNSLLYQATATYIKDIGQHSLNFLLGASQETYKEETTNQSVTGFPNDKTYIFDITRGTTVNANTIYGASNALISYFGRVQYSFKNRYLFAGSLRTDGSSKFGPNNRWGVFPSLSAGWVISEESFLKNVNWMGTTKLRFSWGQAGNDRIGNSAFLSSMAALNYPLGDAQAVSSGFVVGNISNSRLRWEKTDSYNLGLDVGLLKDRISLSLDAYYKKTVDLLLNAPVSLSTGFSSMYDNIGSVENRGFEVELNTVNVIHKGFRWNTSLNVSINRNKITALTNDNADIKLGQGNTVIQRVGYPINSFYLLQATGVLREADFNKDASGNFIAKIPIYSGQKPGDTKYMDANNDGKIDANDYVVAGNYQPKFDFGITNTWTYKNWDLTVLVQGRVGGDLLSIGSRAWNRATNDTRYEYMNSWLKDAYWSEAEPGNGKVPAFFSAVTSQYDTNWMYSAAYLRIKNIALGYNLPVLKKAFKRLRIYASCDNVYLWDSYYPGYSPEGATQDNGSADWGSYPLARTLSFGLNATF